MPKLVKTSSFINRFVFSNKHRIFSLGLDVASCEKSVNICLIDSGQNFECLFYDMLKVGYFVLLEN